MGRPQKPKDKSLTPGISVRLVHSERKIVDTAIQKSGMRQSEWTRKALIYVALNNIVLT